MRGVGLLRVAHRHVGMRLAVNGRMMASSETSFPRCSSDLVWDGGLHATAFVDNGAPLVAGADVGWTPEVLFATATGAALMSTILELAVPAGIDIVGYVSEQRILDSGVISRGTILLAPCISVRSRAAADALQPLIARAIAMMPGSVVVGYELTIKPRVTIVPPGDLPW
jgi:hypothetical protein